MSNKRARNVLITIFVIVWSIIFHYESVRHFYLQEKFGLDVPKVKFLFPPAGWIMFFHVDDSAGYTEVYGIKDGQAKLIDPHDVLNTKTIGYDNIRRNILSHVSYPYTKPSFCRFLKRKFTEYDNFAVVGVYYPSLTVQPVKRLERIIYACNY